MSEINKTNEDKKTKLNFGTSERINEPMNKKSNNQNKKKPN